MALIYTSPTYSGEGNLSGSRRMLFMVTGRSQLVTDGTPVWEALNFLILVRGESIE